MIDNNKEKNIGVLEVQLSTLIDAEDMSVEQPFPLRDSGYESSVVCELKLRVCYLRLQYAMYWTASYPASPIKRETPADRLHEVLH